MTDRDTRDEIASIIEGAECARPRERWALTAADDLVAAGLVVPSGLTELLAALSHACGQYIEVDERPRPVALWTAMCHAQEAAAIYLNTGEVEHAPRVPSGLTAEKLRLWARLAGERAGEYDVPMLDMALTLNEWARALSTQETES